MSPRVRTSGNVGEPYSLYPVAPVSPQVLHKMKTYVLLVGPMKPPRVPMEGHGMEAKKIVERGVREKGGIRDLGFARGGGTD